MNDKDHGEGNLEGFDLSKFEEELDETENAVTEERMKQSVKQLDKLSGIVPDSLRCLDASNALQKAMADSFPERVLAERLSQAVGVFPESQLKGLAEATGAFPLATSGLHERLQALSAGEGATFSRIAAGIEKQQSMLDQVHRDREEKIPVLQDVHIPENPLFETNRRLERIEHRFDQISSIADTSAQTATELQLAAAEFLKNFKEAASKNDQSAADAIRLGKGAIRVAVIIPFLIFFAQVSANFIVPDPEVKILQETVDRLQSEIEALGTTEAAQNQRLIDAIVASSKATALAIEEGWKELQPPADDGPLVID